MTRLLSTPSQIIDALGGTQKTARRLGTTAQAVTNWRARGIPSEKFLVVTHELAKTGGIADPGCFALMQVPHQESAE